MAARGPCALLLAGGSGTRFWPLSRRDHPKQLLPLAPGGRTLLAATFDRIAPLIPSERTFVVVGPNLLDATRAELPCLPEANVLVEPEPRNTAPAIALAAVTIGRRNPGAPIAVFPADHHVAEEDEFRSVAEAALDVASRGSIVTLGVPPTRPETGYGYLRTSTTPIGASRGRSVLSVEAFVEKPDATSAKEYLQSGVYLWNSGIFFFTPETILAAFERHLPGLARGLVSAGDPPSRHALASAFALAPSISIDYAVMEKERGLAALALTAGWSDVGNWDAVAALLPSAEGASGVASLVIGPESADNIVYAPGKVVALLGVNDLVVVDTADAILVCPRDRAQEVRDVVNRLRALHRTNLL